MYGSPIVQTRKVWADGHVFDQIPQNIQTTMNRCQMYSCKALFQDELKMDLSKKMIDCENLHFCREPFRWKIENSVSAIPDRQ
jgi:hypothetical protein